MPLKVIILEEENSLIDKSIRDELLLMTNKNESLQKDCLHKEKIFYAYDENEKDKIIKSEFKKIIPTLSRYKGLGEMPADQLKSTTMNSEKRKLLNINIKQGKKELKETEKLFESLMGKKAEYRFKFIQENANFTNQIDI